MDKLLFTAMSGASRVMMAQQVHANNLANVNTTGFRSDIEQADSVKVKGQGYDSRALVAARAGGSDFSAGTLQHTDNPLDVAIRGKGFFAVEAHEGDEAYTRAGNFTLGAEGELMLGERPVMGVGGAIVIPEYEQLNIGSDGTISVVPQGGGLVQEVGQLKLVNPDFAQLRKSEDGLFRVTGEGGQADAADDVTVAAGYLESSNVNAIDALVNNISLARNFELQVKMMKTAEQLATTGNRLIRGN
ncbi:flagellar biosynthesis protein FlgF [Photobacterium jeanii]|uniref:Flagellar basal-body rod protein FlgF n=1 Tax=Photobacterium jeanii TaxID=858640 RepID=A0A178KI98_9GAMM|nr:flagellar basal-body rod protein FlgF [Photobacterium jeanii]OAN16715.1 flagellar biosynthesis protein FlgF [Photobacterium jeanii]PST87444.1 flagellar basal-body rod protein FlgF [Photobacterium jeanii]